MNGVSLTGSWTILLYLSHRIKLPRWQKTSRNALSSVELVLKSTTSAVPRTQSVWMRVCRSWQPRSMANMSAECLFASMRWRRKCVKMRMARNTSRISSTLRLVSLQISSRHAESICRTMCVSCTITTIWVMRALVVLQLRKSNWHGRLTRASSGLIRSRTGSFTPIRRMDRGTNWNTLQMSCRTPSKQRFLAATSLSWTTSRHRNCSASTALAGHL